MLIIVTSDHKSSHFTQVQQRSLSCESDCEAIDRLEEDKLMSCRLELWVRIPTLWSVLNNSWLRNGGILVKVGWLNRVNPKVKKSTAPEPWVWSYTKKERVFQKKPPKKKYISMHSMGDETQKTIINFGSKLSFILSFLFPERLHCCYIFFSLLLTVRLLSLQVSNLVH